MVLVSVVTDTRLPAAAGFFCNALVDTVVRDTAGGDGVADIALGVCTADARNSTAADTGCSVPFRCVLWFVLLCSFR